MQYVPQRFLILSKKHKLSVLTSLLPVQLNLPLRRETHRIFLIHHQFPGEIQIRESISVAAYKINCSEVSNVQYVPQRFLILSKKHKLSVLASLLPVQLNFATKSRRRKDIFSAICSSAFSHALKKHKLASLQSLLPVQLNLPLRGEDARIFLDRSSIPSRNTKFVNQYLPLPIK